MMLQRPATGRAAAKRQRRATKQRRWRQRQSAGIAVYGVPLARDQLDRLINVGLLGEDESAVAGEVVKAVLDALDDYFRARGV